jgi:D-glycero-D-manno-heptose 1,7-bisphosphate phosphatase
MRPAIFLDRDGTLNADVGFTHRVDDLRLLDGVADGLRHFGQLGFQLLITTNQSGIARGYFSEDQMHAFNVALVERLRTEGIAIAGVYFCPFHPTEGQGKYCAESPLRKPNPGMILAAAKDHHLDLPASFAIGDKASDVAAGQAAGCGTILIAGGRHEGGEEGVTADFVARDLREAAEYVAERRGQRSQTPSAAATRNRP